jgi:hypothetical protein
MCTVQNVLLLSPYRTWSKQQLRPESFCSHAWVQILCASYFHCRYMHLCLTTCYHLLFLLLCSPNDMRHTYVGLLLKVIRVYSCTRVPTMVANHLKVIRIVMLSL